MGASRSPVYMQPRGHLAIQTKCTHLSCSRHLHILSRGLCAHSAVTSATMAGHAEYKEIAVSAPSASLLRQVLGSDASDKEITDAQGRVAILTLNRPKALNALNRSILEEMVQALQVYVGG